DRGAARVDERSRLRGRLRRGERRDGRGHPQPLERASRGADARSPEARLLAALRPRDQMTEGPDGSPGPSHRAPGRPGPLLVLGGFLLGGLLGRLGLFGVFRLLGFFGGGLELYARGRRIDELDVRHGRAVAAPRADLDDARVAARPLLEALAELDEHLLDQAA